MEKEVLAFQQSRQIIELYKSFLEVLEDINSVHEHSVSNLRAALVSTEKRLSKTYDATIYLEPIAMQANYLDKKYYEKIRKKILDKGNDCIRANYEELDKFDIKVKG